jgi:hypothetical protein
LNLVVRVRTDSTLVTPAACEWHDYNDATSEWNASMNWHHVQAQFDADPQVYFARCEALGLQCPFDVFQQLFVDKFHDEQLAAWLLKQFNAEK